MLSGRPTVGSGAGSSVLRTVTGILIRSATAARVRKGATRMRIRADYIYIVVTVGRQKNGYALKMREPKLAQNQFAYRFRIVTDEDEWRKRIKEVELEKVEPPHLPEPEMLHVLVEKDTPQKVLERMAGKRKLY